MKIATYVPSWPPGFMANGIVTYASQLVPALRRLGHEVFVLTHRVAPDHSDAHTLDLRNYASSPTLWDRAMFRLAPESAGFKAASSPIAAAITELVEKHELDVFEIEETFGWSVAVSALKLLPVVVRMHGPWFLNGRFDNPDDKTVLNGRRQYREGRGIQHAQFVTAPSAAVLQAVKNHYGLSLTASRVIPNALEVAIEADTWDVKTCDTSSILFVGRFDVLKGGDLVLRAFAELAAAHPRLRLTFVGPDIGINTADGNIQSFEQFVRSSFPWLRPRIEFCGHVSHSIVMRLRPQHFATIMASRHEMMPYSVLEAMSLGCPLIATAVGGIPELIKDQRNGLLVPSQDVGAMAAACRKLLEDHSLAARLGRQAWLDCRDLCAPEIIAKQTVAAYQAAIDAFKSDDTILT